MNSQYFSTLNLSDNLTIQNSGPVAIAAVSLRSSLSRILLLSKKVALNRSVHSISIFVDSIILIESQNLFLSDFLNLRLLVVHPPIDCSVASSYVGSN